MRSFNVIMCTLFVVACFDSIWARTLGVPRRATPPPGLITLGYLIMVVAAYSRQPECIYLQTARYASLLISLAGAIEVAERIHAGEGELFALLTPYSIGLYFLAYILYRAALQANATLVVAFATALTYLGAPWARIIELAAILAATALIGSVAFRHQGVRFHQIFLERGLIAELAARDGLTGLKNRRAFDEHLTRIWRQALRDRRPLALMMIDVDCFKKFNVPPGRGTLPQHGLISQSTDRNRS